MVLQQNDFALEIISVRKVLSLSRQIQTVASRNE